MNRGLNCTARRAAVSAVVLALAAGAALATEAFVWDQGSVDFCCNSQISDYVSADDFVLPADGQVEFLDLWLSTISAQEDFSGTMGWAILDDDAGGPGALVASGSDDSPTILWHNSYYGRVRVRFASPVVLTAGTYWLALHEGAWLSPFDSTVSAWQQGNSANGGVTHFSSEETNPAGWQAGSADRAFVIYGVFAGATEGELVFASGFEAGTTCAWGDSVFGPTCSD